MQDRFHSVGESYPTFFHITNMHCQFCCILHHRFGECSIWFAGSIVVNFLIWLVEMFAKLSKYPAFFLLLKRFPFDFKNPIGYLIVVMVEYAILGYEYFIISCTLALGIGLYSLVISIAKEIQSILQSISEKTQAKANPSTQSQLTNLFIEYINAHADIKQLSVIYLYNIIFSCVFHCR